MSLSFLDLPAEIRNEVYGLMLQHSRPLQVVRTWIKHHYALKLERSPFAPLLLATCRAINSEATPILYGSNEIVLGGTSVPTFVNQIRTSVKQLRHIEIGYHGTNATLKSALRALQNADELKTLSIRILCFGEGRNAWVMARGLLLWVKAQCSRQRSSGVEKKTVWDVLKVLKFETGVSVKESFFDWPKTLNEYEEEVKEKLVTLLR